MCLNVTKLVIIGTDYYDIAQLLLFTIIVCSKNYTISIIGKENKKISQLMGKVG